MYEKAKLAFESYMKGYDLNNQLILLKYKHTYKVVELMSELAFRLNLDKEQLELAKIIGLLHDIGRFKQIKEYNVISDKKSNIDHAQDACTYLFDNNYIRNFIDDNKYDNIIKKAISNHNKLKLDTNLTDDELFYAKMIRDVDKIDIFRVIAIESKEEFRADEVSEEILKEFSLHKTINNNIIKTVSDRVICRLAFVFDINFNESFDILVSSDNFDLYLSTVNVDTNSEKLFRKLKEICFDTINKGVDNNE